MEMLPGEKKLSESNDGTVLLTTRRIRLDKGQGRAREFVSITLDQVASCSIRTRSHPFLLLFGALFALAGFQIAGERLAAPAVAVGAVLCVLCIILYFTSREQLITVASAGEAIRIRTRGMSRPACIQFIEDVECAKMRWSSVQFQGEMPRPGAA